MEIGALKEEENRLKRDIISNLEEEFIDQFIKWKKRQELFNEVVEHYNASGNDLKGLDYDEFCRLFIRGSKSVLNDHLKMENIVPDNVEMDKIRAAMKNKDNGDEFAKGYALVMEVKYAVVRTKMAQVWDERVLRSIINEAYGAEHYRGILAAKAEVLKRI